MADYPEPDYDEQDHIAESVGEVPMKDDEIAAVNAPREDRGRAENTTPAPPSAAQLRAQAQAFLEAAAEVERDEARALLLAREAARPKMPKLTDGVAVVMFTRYQSGRNYNYAALGWRDGVAIRWVVTGHETRRFNWSGLLEFIGEANWPTLAVVTEAVCIGPAPAMEAPVAEVMGSYGRVVRTDSLGPQSDPFSMQFAENGLDASYHMILHRQGRGYGEH